MPYSGGGMAIAASIVASARSAGAGTIDIRTATVGKTLYVTSLQLSATDATGYNCWGYIHITDAANAVQATVLCLPQAIQNGAGWAVTGNSIQCEFNNPIVVPGGWKLRLETASFAGQGLFSRMAGYEL